MINESVLDRVVKQTAETLAEHARKQNVNFPRTADEVLSSWLVSRQSLDDATVLIRLRYRRSLKWHILRNVASNLLKP